MPTSSAKLPVYVSISMFVYLDLGIGIALIALLFSIFLSSGSMHSMNSAQLRASPCFTLLAIVIITDLYPLTDMFAFISL